MAKKIPDDVMDVALANVRDNVDAIHLCAGEPADILNLYNSNEGHTICVTKDRTKMVSNGNVVSLNPAIWESDMMKYFNNEYEVII